MTQLPEGFGVTLAVEDGFDDVHRAEAIKVTEDMVDFEVHFGEGFLHVLKVAEESLMSWVRWRMI